MNVLAVQRRRVGEILMTTPALRALKARFPQSEVTYVCEQPFSPVLRSNEHVDTLMPVVAEAGVKGNLRLVATLRERGFDLALDFEGSPGSALLTAASGASRRIGFRSAVGSLAYTDRVDAPGRGEIFVATEKLALLEPLGIDIRTAGRRPLLRVEERARDWAQRTFDSAGVGSSELVVTLAPGARASEYRWPLELFARLLEALSSTHSFEALLLLGPEDQPMGARLARLTDVPLFQLSMHPSLAQVGALLDRSDLHIGNENAALHMAAALGTAAVAIHETGARRRWSVPGDPLQVGLEPPLASAAATLPRPNGSPATEHMVEADRRAEPADAGAAPGAAAGASDMAASSGPPIAMIGVDDVYRAVLGLEVYLPRLRAARRMTASARPPGQLLRPPRQAPPRQVHADRGPVGS